MTDDHDAGEDGSTGAESSIGSGEETPLAGLAERVGDPNQQPTPNDDGLFDQPDVESIDEDSLWEQLQEGQPAEPEVDDEDVRVINAHQYCHQCEYLDEPPTMGCTLEDTEIREVVSMGRFRVVNCPIVREDDDLSGDR